MDRFWKYKVDHLIFWAATIGFHMFTKSGLIQSAGIEHFVLESLVRNGLLALLIYLNLIVLMPRFAQQGRFVEYICLLTVSLAGYVSLKNVHDVYLYGYVLNDNHQRDFFANTYYNFSIAVFYVAFSIALSLSKAWYFQREQLRKMEVEKLNAELDYLKAQINPHFVFNSINTIYFQIDKRNEEARHTLSTFSDMLRYQLYECNGHEVPIEQEIRYLNNYIQLQKLRKDENYQITFSCSPEVKGFTIAPLLLICFVENAFKHISNNAGTNVVSVTLNYREGKFTMDVFNTCDEKPPAISEGSGIGLKNVKRRLELLYPQKHALEIYRTPESFKTDLTIKVG